VDFTDNQRGDDYDRRIGQGPCDRDVDDSGQVGFGYRLYDADGDGGHPEFDRGDAGESIDQCRIDATIYGDRNFFRFEHAELDQFGDVDFVKNHSRDHFGGRFSDGRGCRLVHDSGGVGIDHGFHDVDGECGGTDSGFDRGDAVEPVDSKRFHTAIHRNRNL
jgi:hypothetical protein